MLHRFTAVILAALAAAALGACGTSDDDPNRAFAASADAICAQLLSQDRPSQPHSTTQALEIQRRMLAEWRRAVNRLETLKPPRSLAADFRAGLADNRELMQMLSEMIERPDYVRLAITLPDHPEAAPGWLRAWQARAKRLTADLRLRFSRIDAPSCLNFMSG